MKESKLVKHLVLIHLCFSAYSTVGACKLIVIIFPDVFPDSQIRLSVL